MREVLGYECKEVKPDEAEKKWKELTTAYKNRLRNMKSEDELETNKKPM
jgi:hypothetical protein